MGKWLEILSEIPDEDVNYLSDKPDLIIGEISPNPLIGASKLILKSLVNEFPNLYTLNPLSGSYHEEILDISSKKTTFVLNEFQRIKRIGNYQEFVKGLNATTVQKLWKEYNWNNDIDDWLAEIENLLTLAIEKKYWVRILL